MMISEKDIARIAAQERIETLARARAFEDLLKSPGWKVLYAYREQMLEAARTGLLKADTGDRERAINELQRWQIAERFLEEEAQFINSTLERAQEIRGSVTLDDALLMESINEQQHPGQPGTDRAGY